PSTSSICTRSTPARPEISTLSLHDALPILGDAGVNMETITTSEIKISVLVSRDQALAALRAVHAAFALDKEPNNGRPGDSGAHRSEEHTSELQSQSNLVCRLLLEKKKKKKK